MGHRVILIPQSGSSLLPLTVLGLWQCELLTTKFDTKMKMNYSYNEMKRAFECGRNFQLTGENNFKELIEELNQALPQADVMRSVCCGEELVKISTY